MDIVLLIIPAALYFFPTLIAWAREHHAVMAVFMTNLFLGWTFIGWVVALVWAVAPVKRMEGGYCK